jgi:hypothetical protein
VPGEPPRFSARDLDVLALATLLVLTAWFGRSFSRVGIDAANLYVSELLLLVTGVAMLVRLGPGEAWRLVRERLPLVGLVLILLAGAIATARGVIDWGVGLTIEDIGFFEYALVLPLVVLVASDARRRQLVLRALLLGGVGGAVVFAIANLYSRGFDEDTFLVDQEGTFGLLGFYSTLLLAWLVSRFGHGLQLFGGADRDRSRVWLLLGVVAMVLVFALIALSDKRSVWVAGLAALFGAALLAPAGRRLLTLGVAVLVFGLGTLLSFGVERALGPVPGPGVSEEVELEDDSGGEGGSGEGSGSQIAKEAKGILARGDSAEAENTRWRLAYWGELISRVPDAPLFGVGFGEPSRFVWKERRYDFRDENPANWAEVSGPHNGFVELAYRMGLVGLAGMVVLLAAAALRSSRLLRPGALTSARRSWLVFTCAAFLSVTATVALNQALQGPFIGIFFWTLLALLFVWSSPAGERPPAGMGAPPESAGAVTRD